VRLPAPPVASAYERAGERAAFSFPLVAVAGARHEGGGAGGDAVRLAAAGVANTPVALDPEDPLRDLPGNPQTGWKRTVLATLAERVLARLA
jgi:CO/xanthine dehydrogenase FAD-binding subunit